MSECCLRTVKHLCLYSWCTDEDDDDVPLQEQQIKQWKEEEAEPKKDDSSNIVYQGIKEPVDEADLRSSFDADEEYYKNFERLDNLSSSTSDLVRGFISIAQLEEMAAESERAFSDSGVGELTPREVVVNLNRLTSCIRLVDDMDKKRTFIERYEMHKSNFDRDNKDDREKAEFYLENARKISVAYSDRIEYYQTAIRFTNNLVEKERIRMEYRQYCRSLQKKSSSS